MDGKGLRKRTRNKTCSKPETSKKGRSGPNISEGERKIIISAMEWVRAAIWRERLGESVFEIKDVLTSTGNICGISRTAAFSAQKRDSGELYFPFVFYYASDVFFMVHFRG